MTYTRPTPHSPARPRPASGRNRGVTGAAELTDTSCTHERTPPLPPPATTPVWTARLHDPADGSGQARLVHLAADSRESFEQACRWVATGTL